MEHSPPKWAEKLLQWYCDPLFLEEIQGDALELYQERVASRGKIVADTQYILDVVSFYRASNIRAVNENHRPSLPEIIWRLNFKISLRNVLKNRGVFLAKTLSLSLSFAFALLLINLVLQEYSYDTHLKDHKRMYRVSSAFTTNGIQKKHVMTPELLAETLQNTLPEIEAAAWYDDEIYNWRSVFEVNDQVFTEEIALATSTSFVRLMEYEFLKGTEAAFEEPYAIALTASTASKFFGEQDPIGELIYFMDFPYEVAAVLADPPLTSHLGFDILISYKGLDGMYCDCWENLTAKTYFKVKEGTDIDKVVPKIDRILNEHLDQLGSTQIIETNELVVSSIVQPISTLHLSDQLIEETSTKRHVNNLNLLLVLAFIFLVAGLIYFVVLSLFEFSLGFRKARLLQLFGGNTASMFRYLMGQISFHLLIALPLSAVIYFIGVRFFKQELDVEIASDQLVFLVPALLVVIITLGLLLSIACAKASGKASGLAHLMSIPSQFFKNGLNTKQILIGIQLSFSILLFSMLLIIMDQFNYINSADKGFETEQTLIIKLQDEGFDDSELLIDRINQLQGVKKAAASSFYTDELEWMNLFEIGNEKHLVNFEYWDADFTHLIGLEVLAGRNFDPARITDRYHAYIVNEAAVKAFGWSEPVGKKIAGPLTGHHPQHEGEVIGVIKNFQSSKVRKNVEPTIIFMGTGEWASEYLYVKLEAAEAKEILPRIEKEFEEQYTGIPFTWEWMDVNLANQYREELQIKKIFQISLLISLLLSIMCAYSIVALTVKIKAKEMSIRRVVGATELKLIGLHLRKLISILFLSVAITAPFIYLMADAWLEDFNLRIDISTKYLFFPLILIVVILLLTLFFQSVQRSKINPIDILNNE